MYLHFFGLVFVFSRSEGRAAVLFVGNLVASALYSLHVCVHTSPEKDKINKDLSNKIQVFVCLFCFILSLNIFFIMSANICLIFSPNVCFYYVTKWLWRCSVFNGQPAHPVIPCCGCPHQITIPNNISLH